MELEELIAENRARYGAVYRLLFYGEYVYFRPLTRGEFIWLSELEIDNDDKDEETVRLCVFWPEVDWDYTPAGWVTKLAQHILGASGYLPGKVEEVLARERERLKNPDFQIDAVIMAAFPYITLERIDEMTEEERIRHYAYAELILKLRNPQVVA